MAYKGCAYKHLAIQSCGESGDFSERSQKSSSLEESDARLFVRGYLSKNVRLNETQIETPG